MVPKVPPLPYRKVHRLLHAAGFAQIRQKGSHILYRHPDGRTTEVPRHAYDISPKLIAKILKDAGIDPDTLRRKA